MARAALLDVWRGVAQPVIGMLHLPPLPGAPGYQGNLQRIRESLMADADALAQGGVQGLMIENFGDAPFFPGRVPAYVVAHIASLAEHVRRRIDLPLGINVLRNDGAAALGIAAAVGAQFIRVNVLCGARVTDQGITLGIAHRLLRLRRTLDAAHVRILADVNVKHSGALGFPRPIADEFADTIERGGADAVIASGSATGKPAGLDEVREMRAAAGELPLLIGSGVSVRNIHEYRELADGFIIGSSLKRGGVIDGPIDVQRVRDLMNALR